MRILLAEDDELLGSGIRAGLAQNGFQVDWVRDGVAAERELATGAYQAAVLDLGLPRLDGMEVLRQVRARRNTTPVLVLTARDAVPARIAGLDAGADDFIAKPFDLDELAARIRSACRRAAGRVREHLVHGDLVLDIAERQVTQAGKPVALTLKEFRILQMLVEQSGRILSREQLEKNLYSWGEEVESNAIQVHIHHLRKKLGRGLIRTVHAIGYCCDKPLSAAAA